MRCLSDIEIQAVVDDESTDAIRRHVAQCVVQHLDMEGRTLQKIRLAQILKAGVVRHRKIGAIEL